MDTDKMPRIAMPARVRFLLPHLRAYAPSAAAFAVLVTAALLAILLWPTHGIASTLTTRDGTAYDGVVIIRPNAIMIGKGGQIVAQKPLTDILDVHIENPNAQIHGLRGEFFEGNEFRHSRLVRLDPNLDLAWQGTEPLTEGLTADRFCARWTGLLVPKFSETYTFTTDVDDWMRLWIDDKLVIDHWNKMLGQEKGTAALLADHKHTFRVEYANNAGPGILKLSWSSDHQKEEIIPSSAFLTPPVQMHTGGLRGEYFEGDNFEKPVASRIDPQIDFIWSDNPPFPQLPHDHYTVRWTGFIKVHIGGNYTIGTTSDDGSRVWLDNKLVIDNWGSHAPTPKSANVILHAETPHKIRVEYWQDVLGAMIELWTERPGHPREVIPATWLFPPDRASRQEIKPAEPVKGWRAAQMAFTGVCLTDGSLIAGTVAMQTDAVLLKSWDGGTVKIPLSQVSAVVLEPIGGDTLAKMPRDKIGALLTNEDFSEGSPTFANPLTVQLDSVLFGLMTLTVHKDVLAVCLKPTNARLPQWEVDLADGSRYAVDDVKPGDGTVSFTHPLLGPLTVQQTQLAGIHFNGN